MSKEKRKQKRKELTDRIKILNAGFNHNNEFKYNYEDTKLLCLIYKCPLPKEEFDTSIIRLYKDTDWRTDYMIYFYNNNNFILNKYFLQLITMSKNIDYVKEYIYKKYPLSEKEIQDLKAEKEIEFKNKYLIPYKNDDHKFRFGKYIGEYIKDIIKNDPSYIIYCIKHYKYFDEYLKECNFVDLKLEKTPEININSLVYFGKYKNKYSWLELKNNDRSYFDWVCYNTKDEKLKNMLRNNIITDINNKPKIKKEITFDIENSEIDKLF